MWFRLRNPQHASARRRLTPGWRCAPARGAERSPRDDHPGGPPESRETGAQRPSSGLHAAGVQTWVPPAGRSPQSPSPETPPSGSAGRRVQTVEERWWWGRGGGLRPPASPHHAARRTGATPLRSATPARRTAHRESRSTGAPHPAGRTYACGQPPPPAPTRPVQPVTAGHNPSGNPSPTCPARHHTRPPTSPRQASGRPPDRPAAGQRQAAA